ncbi:hypothetical protein [Streptomyces sp. NPDC059909]|uniref:hypothetical protein n=1 Tax=Streptomyces sp. NPDC059909 TaxID=3346998 RepID=UPI00364C7441
MRRIVWGLVVLVGLLAACGTGTNGGDPTPGPGGAESPSTALDGDQTVLFDVSVAGAAPGATSKITYSMGDSLVGETVTVPALTPWTHAEQVSGDALHRVSLDVMVDVSTVSDPFAANVLPRVSCSIAVPGRPTRANSGDGMCFVYLQN